MLSASNGAPAFILGSMTASKGSVFATASYVGQLAVDGRPSGSPTDGYTNGAVITMDAKLSSVWTATLAGAGTQTAASAAPADDLSLFVSGVATPKGAITVSTPSADKTYETAADGGYVIQLAGANGALQWIRTFEGKDTVRRSSGTGGGPSALAGFACLGGAAVAGVSSGAVCSVVLCVLTGLVPPSPAGRRPGLRLRQDPHPLHVRPL